jgi:hypothetical protein
VERGTQQRSSVQIKRFFAVVLFAVVLCYAYGCAQKENRPNGGGHFLTLSEDGAWCWFQGPRAIYIDGRHKRTYAGWITRDGKLRVGSYDHETERIDRHTLKENWEADDHNSNSFLALPNGHIMAFYTRHNGIGLYSKTTSKPEDITSWNDENTIMDTAGITYTQPVYLVDEKRYFLFWRGESWKPTFSTSTDGKIWTTPHILIRQKGREDSHIRPYLKVASDGKSTIHLAFTDGHPKDEPKNSVYYLRYTKGGFYKADGHAAGTMNDLPVSHQDSDLVYDGRKNGVRAWIWDIAADQKGYPVIVYAVFPDKTDHRYRYARWDGHHWIDSEITPAGKWFPKTPEGASESEPYYSGGITLDHGDPSVVYLSRLTNKRFEIERRSTADSGTSWSVKAITAESPYNNVRPVVPIGYNRSKDHLLWMTGNYIGFTNFRTGISMLVLGKQ